MSEEETKELIDLIFNKDVSILNKYKKEIERLKTRLEEAQLAYLSVDERNRKAIEYIKNNDYCDEGELLEILDKENK